MISRNIMKPSIACGVLTILSIFTAGCGGGGGSSTPPPPTTYTLSVNSVLASSVSITVSPADANSAGNGSTSFARVYNAGTTVTLSAPTSAGKDKFSSWTGCATAVSVTCTVSMNANTTVAANYTGPTVTSVNVTPGPVTVTIGATKQFAATVAGTGSFDSTVTWSIVKPSGSSSSAGTIDGNGLYTSPYPAPASVTVVATSTNTPTVSGSAVVTLSPPPTPSGPPLGMTVDLGNITHPINPYIYGWNGFQVPQSEAKAVNLPINRWGGDATTRYNYLADAYNSASDYWYQNELNTPSFDLQVTTNNATGTATLGTVPLIGWTTKGVAGCSYSLAKYGAQQRISPNGDCGNGILVNGNQVVNDPTDTSMKIDETFTTGWIKYLVNKFGTAAKGGVAIYDLDNEPTWWDAVHRDVHGSQIPGEGPFTYDEVTTKGLTYAKAIKDVDPTAEVSGPVIDWWPAYFYSKKDVETGWGSGPCYCYNGNPVDRLAHGNVPMIEYYLQQFKKNEDLTHIRLLDYLDVHGYFAATNAGFAPAGDTILQQARLNSTRVLWDPTYTDPNITDPNITTAAPAYPLQLIPTLKQWVADNYPGTKIAIDEYNWGGLEQINGALTQADILGIFGREGLDLGALWGTPDPVSQIPGLVAFQVFRNYDGSNSEFGDQALASTSTDQSQLAVYGALRTSDQAVTIVVINKSFGDLPGAVFLPNLVATGPAKAFLYSNAHLAGILAQPDVPVFPSSSSVPVGGIATTFPAASITILVVPTR